MTFPDLEGFAPVRAGAYERQMGRQIAALLQALAPFSPDCESNAAVLRLVDSPDRWSAGHAFFDHVRARLLWAQREGHQAAETQYWFEEACCQAVYNATSPADPFDPSAPYFVVPFALVCGRHNPEALAAVLAVLSPAM